MFKAEVLLLLVQGKSDNLQILNNCMLLLVPAWLGAWREVRTPMACWLNECEVGGTFLFSFLASKLRQDNICLD